MQGAYDTWVLCKTALCVYLFSFNDIIHVFNTYYNGRKTFETKSKHLIGGGKLYLKQSIKHHHSAQCDDVLT